MPKWHEFISNIPSDYSRYFKLTFQADKIPLYMTVAATTAALWATDSRTWYESDKLFKTNKFIHNFSDVINLLLIDFKGGATFLGLARAPHVAAVITNLAEEAPLVARMRDALAGEMNRRQQRCGRRAVPASPRTNMRVGPARSCPHCRHCSSSSTSSPNCSASIPISPTCSSRSVDSAARWACICCSPANGSTRDGCVGWKRTCPIGYV